MKKVGVALTFGVPRAPGVDPEGANIAYVRLRCLTFNPGKFQSHLPSGLGVWESISNKQIHKETKKQKINRYTCSYIYKMGTQNLSGGGSSIFG